MRYEFRLLLPFRNLFNDVVGSVRSFGNDGIAYLSEFRGIHVPGKLEFRLRGFHPGSQYWKRGGHSRAYGSLRSRRKPSFGYRREFPRFDSALRSSAENLSGESGGLVTRPQRSAGNRCRRAYLRSDFTDLRSGRFRLVRPVFFYETGCRFACGFHSGLVSGFDSAPEPFDGG